MDNFEYTVTTNKPFADVVEAVEKKSVEAGFRVLHTHDVTATLAEKGFPREPLKIVGLIARTASQPIRRYTTVDRTEKCSTNQTLKRIPAIASPQITANRDQPQLPRRLTSKNGV